MKKFIFALSLAMILILSGCFAFMQGFNAVPNPEISANIISKMQNNIKTHTLEGYSSESTFGDVLKDVGTENVRYASFSFNTDFLGYPSVMRCSFTNFSGKLLLDDMNFYIAPGAKQEDDKLIVEQVLAKMDTELGSYDEKTEEEDETEYTWEKDGWHIDLSVLGEGWIPDSAAHISVYAPLVIGGKLPKIPDILPYQLGTEIGTVLRDVTAAALPEDFEDSGSIEYIEQGIEIRLKFETDEAGAMKLSWGSYSANLNGMLIKDSLDYFESLADGLEAAIGVPDERGYGIPDVEGSYGGTGGGEGMSAEDVLKSGQKYYYFEMSWPGIYFSADYGMGTYFDIDFNEQYFSGEASE